MPTLTKVMKQYILHWGEMGTRWGINRTVAQIHALLYLSPAPLTAEEIAEKLCQDVAVIPFLWVVPLALYLLSFIICFDSPRWYVRYPFTLALIAALGGLCWALFVGSDWSLSKQVAMYCG